VAVGEDTGKAVAGQLEQRFHRLWRSCTPTSNRYQSPLGEGHAGPAGRSLPGLGWDCYPSKQRTKVLDNIRRAETKADPEVKVTRSAVEIERSSRRLPGCSTAAISPKGLHRVQDLFSYEDKAVAVRILVVDDERAVRESLERTLRFEGYEVAVAGDGAEALDRVQRDRPDAVVLDVLMPRLDGLAVCRRLRARGDDLPVLLLTARDAVADRVTGLDVGADDYLVKPFALEELLARLRAMLRRVVGAPEEAGRLAFADLRADLGTREVRRGDRLLVLTRTEFLLIELLLRHPRQVLTRSLILERVWGFDFEATSNSLEVYVGHLRRKTEAGGEPRLLHTVRGVGYVLREPGG